MAKMKTLLILALCGIVIIAGCQEYLTQSPLNRHRSHWERSKPSIYYLEVIETQHSTDIQHRAVISNNTPANVIWNNGSPDGTIFEELTVESIFDVGADWCISKGVECLLEFDKELDYLKELVVYDWLVIEVTDLVPCDNLEICMSIFEQGS